MNAVKRSRIQRGNEEQRSTLQEGRRHCRILIEAIPQLVWTANSEGHVDYATRRWFDYRGLDLKNGCHLGWDYSLHPEDRERTWRAWVRWRRCQR